MLMKFQKMSRRMRMAWGLLGAGIFSMLICIAAFSFPSIGVLEWRIVDSWARMNHGARISKNVAVIGIDDRFLDDYGWPLEKDIYGDLIDFCIEMGAKVIGIDIVFADNLESCGKGDSVFREMVGFSPQVVLSYAAVSGADDDRKIQGKRSPIPEKFSIGRRFTAAARAQGAILPYPLLLEKTHHLGFFNLLKPFADGVDRKMPLCIAYDSLLFPSLGLQCASLFRDTTAPEWDMRRNRLLLGHVSIPIEKTGDIHIDFIDSIPVYPLSEIRQAHREWLLGESPRIGKSELSGRAVIIGNSAMSLGDFGITPLSTMGPAGRSPNVLMHARSVATLLEGTAIGNHGRSAAILFAILMVMCAGVLFYLLPAPAATIIAVILFGLSLFAGRQMYLMHQFVPMLEGTSAGVLFCIFSSLVVYLDKELDRRYLYSTFSRYLSPQVIEEMYRKQINPVLGGEEVRATAFFTDIEGFSRFSEELSPPEIVNCLNEYFTAMTDILLANNGTLDKFIGDAIVGFFGAPLATKTHARDACLTAVRMQERLADLRRQWQSDPVLHEGVKNLKMRIGINTGLFVTGNIGCEKRMNYTMMGDTVNLAARLESACKEYNVYTVTGEATREMARDDFIFRKLDKIRVKGRNEPVFIYQLMGTPREDDSKTYELIRQYEHALDIYFTGDFVSAGRLFGETLHYERVPDKNNPSRVMMARCEHLRKITAKDWDGIYRMEKK
jgi:adenylate cyclase